MCWSQKSSSLPPTQLVSDGTVKIFKICKMRQGNLCGYIYTTFNYILGQEYQTTIDMSYVANYKKYIGNQGFHSYDASKCSVNILEMGDIFGNVKRACIEVLRRFDNSIYHTAAYQIKDVIFKDATACFIEGYLPKGTRYYVNEYGEIISDKIVLSKIIPTNSIKNSQYYFNKPS